MEIASTRSESINSNDIRFISFLNEFIEQELTNLDENGFSFQNKERFLIFKEAFARVVAYVRVYKNLLHNIKTEYEVCIDRLEQRTVKREEDLDQLNKCEDYLLTVENLELRKAELEKKLTFYTEHSQQLKTNLNEVIEKNERFRPKTVNKYAFLVNREITKESENRDNFKLIPGVSLDKATDLQYLDNLLRNLEARVTELSQSQSKKFVPKQQKHELEVTLFEHISAKENKKVETAHIKTKINMYRLALNATKEYYGENKAKHTNIQDALSKALLGSLLSKQNSKMTDDGIVGGGGDEAIGEDDDASQLILDYIERFNDLIENEKYAEAAYYAVASPKNILRNIETVYRFKEVSGRRSFTAATNPLLMYCNAIVDSIGEHAPKPNEKMSNECVKVALKYNKLDLLTRWIAQRKLTFSLYMGKYVQEYARRNQKNVKNSYELALFVFKDIGAQFESALCLAKLGRLSAMIDLIASRKELATNADTALKLLKECPSLELAALLIDFFNKAECMIPTERIVSVFLDSDQPENGLKFLQIQIEKLESSTGSDNKKEEELSKLKASYDTLLKYSFLAQDDEQLAKEAKHGSSKSKLQNIYFSAKTTNYQASQTPPATRDANNTI